MKTTVTVVLTSFNSLNVAQGYAFGFLSPAGVVKGFFEQPETEEGYFT
ncbi:MAG: hypothetical protein MRJ92_10125 [Nitrospira sp.]|nr:hypothetical protein [Nitrospira sp.]